MTDCRRQFSEHTPTLSAFQKLNWEAKNPSGRRCVPPTARCLGAGTGERMSNAASLEKTDFLFPEDTGACK